MKIAIISGGSRGIGETISKSFMQGGYLVVIGSRTKPKFDLFNNSVWVQMDATTQGGHEELMKAAQAMNGSVEVYVNNVGFSEWRSIANVDDSFINNMFASNLFSTIYGCKIASRNLTTGGSIINISSLAGKRGTKNNSIYCATKFGVNGLTQSLAKELGKRNIRVNAICPVLIETPGLISALSQEESPAFNSKEDFLTEFIKTQVSLPDLPKSQDIADMCLFLASDKSSSITGQCINIDSGVLPS